MADASPHPGEGPAPRAADAGKAEPAVPAPPGQARRGGLEAPPHGCLLPNGCLLRWLKRVVIAIYLSGATVVSLLLAALMPTEGPLLTGCVPAERIFYVHLKDGDATWRAIENSEGGQALWEDEEFQRRTGLKEKLEKARQELARKPVLPRLISLDRAGLRFVLDRELALAVFPPGPDAKPGEDLPVMAFARVKGWRGALIRAAAIISTLVEKKRQPGDKDGRLRSLGGNLVAMLSYHAPPLAASPAGGSAAVTPDTFLEFHIGPSVIAAAQPVSWLQGFPVNPTLTDYLALPRPPDEVSVLLRWQEGGGVALDGEWHGPLPAPEAPAALPAVELPEGATPMLDLRAPLNARHAFHSWLDREMKSSAKTQRRWEERLGEVADAGVDLERDLWPNVGHTLRLQIIPPPEGSGADQAAALASFPLRAQGFARRALAEMARAYGEGLYDGKEPRDARRPYFVRLQRGELERYVWVRGTYLRPEWLVGEGALAFTSDAGPLALMPNAPGLAPAEPEPADASAPAVRPAQAVSLRYRTVLCLRVDGERLAPQVAGLVQRNLEDERDEMGAAEFLAKYPDERAVRGLAEKITRLVGDLCLELRAPEKPGGDEPGTLRGRWRPRLRR